MAYFLVPIVKFYQKLLAKTFYTLANDHTVPPYQEAFNKSGYGFKLSYDETISNENKKQNIHRKITWFKPPFSKNVEKKLG